MEEIALRKSDATNTTKRLSFRDIAHVFFVNEGKMFSEESPLFTGQRDARTTERSFFEYLISGKDHADLIKIEKEEIRKTRINAKIEYIKLRLASEKENLLRIENSLANQRKLPDVDFSSLNESYNVYFDNLNKAKISRKKLVDEQVEVSSEINYKRQLLARFELLLEHYDSDLDRLEFIDEGSNLFSLLNYVACPVCGTEIEEQHYKCIRDNEVLSETLTEAIASEFTKIQEKIFDLRHTTNEIMSTIQEHEKVLIKIVDEIKYLDDYMEHEVMPVVTGLKDKVASLIGDQLLAKEEARLEQEIIFLEKDLAELEEQRKQKISAQRSDAIEVNLLLPFEQIILQILKDWKFPDISTVRFDFETWDIIINGKNRGSFGKGYRAVGHSAFVIGLLQFLRSGENGYNRLIVIDSPLTAYKKKDKPPSGEEQVKKELELEFFRSIQVLANESQIIVLENKEPPKDIREKVNYLHFSGRNDIPRSGFL